MTVIVISCCSFCSSLYRRQVSLLDYRTLFEIVSRLTLQVL